MPAGTANVNLIDTDLSKPYLEIGDKEQYVVASGPMGNSLLKFQKWTSSDASVATVDSLGNITAVCSGDATISVIAETFNGQKQTKSSVVHVYGPSQIVNGVTTWSINHPIKIGESTTIKYAINPVSAMVKGQTWLSSDPTIATVSSTGVVTGIKAGTATITWLFHRYTGDDLGSQDTITVIPAISVTS